MAPSSVSLHHRIHAVVHGAIAEHIIAPGSILLEAVIADALLTSRTPVKAALELLRSDGRVAKLRGRGYIVLEGDGAMPARRLRLDRARFSVLAPTAIGGPAPAAWLRIYEEVESEVAAGAIRGSLRLLEAEIAKSYGVSRTVVRDVLSRLERGGLIEKDERRRWRLVALTTERVRQIYELRRALEPLALRLAAERGRHAGAFDMRDRLAAAQARLPEVGPQEIQAFERELHIDLLGECGNPHIVNALHVGQVQICANGALFGRLRMAFPMILSEHLAIADRLADDDVAGAVEALSFHLEAWRATLIGQVIELAATSRERLPPYLQED